MRRSSNFLKGMSMSAQYIRQHLIDPAMCTRCNTCESSCPIEAITHDSNNYVVKADLCNGCLECTWGCPTGAIDSWRLVPDSEAYSLDDQFGWSSLPAQLEVEAGAVIGGAPDPAAALQPSAPHSAATPAEALFTQENPALATITVNRRLTGDGTGSDIHHLVLDFGDQHFPVLEGQNIAIVPPGVDEQGRPHVPRYYSIASARSGEVLGNDLALTVKRVVADHTGQPVRGVGSNHLCDLARGDQVKVLGPFGGTYLMPNHAGSHLLMICTGTGIAPMRAMLEQRHRVPVSGARLILFYGGRTPKEMAYHDDLVNFGVPGLELHLAYSRMNDRPKEYVQDCLRTQGDEIAGLLRDPECHLYVCGLKSMEQGIVQALIDICSHHGMDWSSVRQQLREQGRVHFETY
ncbi:Benzoyl-CoA oxygenase component A [compost metagenome]